MVYAQITFIQKPSINSVNRGRPCSMPGATRVHLSTVANTHSQYISDAVNPLNLLHAPLNSRRPAHTPTLNHTAKNAQKDRTVDLLRQFLRSFTPGGIRQHTWTCGRPERRQSDGVSRHHRFGFDEDDRSIGTTEAARSCEASGKREVEFGRRGVWGDKT